MKKIFFLSALMVLGIISCKKKKYNCHCVTNINANFSNYVYPTKNVPMDKKMTEKQAKAVCQHEAEDINTTYTNFITDNGTQSSNGITNTTICTLE